MEKIFVVLFILFVVFSCNDVKKDEQNNTNYIDIKIQSTREYTPDERTKIRLALKRFNENVVVENNQYVLTVKSGDEIGIPNEFFYIFKMGIDDTNDLIREAGNDWELAKPN